MGSGKPGMGKTVLFSLDTLVNVPGAFADALEKVFVDFDERRERRKQQKRESRQSPEFWERDRFLELVANAGLDVKLAITNLCAVKSQRGMDEDQVGIQHMLRDDAYFFKIWRKAYTQFLRVLPDYSNAKLHAARILTDMKTAKDMRRNQREFQAGIFYQLPQRVLEGMLKHAKLDVPIVAGCETDTEDPLVPFSAKEVEEKMSRAICAGSVIVVKQGDDSYRKLAKRVKANYVQCYESHEAPLGLVREALGL